MNDERNKTLEELYSNYYDSVYRFCMTVTGFDRRYYHLIEDCVQDAFIAAILKYDDFKHYNNPIGWIARVASNRLKSEIRKDRNRRKTISSRMQIRSEDVAFFGNCVEQEIEREELKQDILHIYQMLTDMEKTVFQEYFLEGKTVKNAAFSSGLSENSVRAAIRRIRKRSNKTKLFFIFGVLFLQFTQHIGKGG